MPAVAGCWREFLRSCTLFTATAEPKKQSQWNRHRKEDFRLKTWSSPRAAGLRKDQVSLPCCYYPVPRCLPHLDPKAAPPQQASLPPDLVLPFHSIACSHQTSLNAILRTSQVGQWLRLCASHTGIQVQSWLGN